MQIEGDEFAGLRQPIVSRRNPQDERALCLLGRSNGMPPQQPGAWERIA